jgi:hypothetical protein
MGEDGVAVVTVSRIVLLVGVILIVLSAFGIQFGPMSLFEFGVGVCFAAGLVP